MLLSLPPSATWMHPIHPLGLSFLLFHPRSRQNQASLRIMNLRNLTLQCSWWTACPMGTTAHSLS